MNGNDRKIEILTPFNLALEWTKQVLFRPFDLEKWLVIGFAAFLSHLAGGSGTGFNFNFNPASFRNRGNWDFRTTSHNLYSTSDHVSLWLILFVTAAILVIMIAVVLVLLWIGCRGRFIFVDCVVRNRGAIKEPWRELGEVANSFFGFLLVTLLIFVLMAFVAGSPFILWLALHHGDVSFGPAMVLGIGLWIAFVFIFALAWGLISQFMIVTMYRRRCGAVEAFRSTVSLMMSDPVPFILYILFLFVLTILVAMISCVATCVTCCIAAIPYVGTVILLPLYVFLTAYPLLFARQFGSDWDAWANLTAPTLAVPPTTPAPPVQPPPPPPSEAPPGSRSPYEPPETSSPPPPPQS
ncbi:MAG: hypothetical protein DMG68_19700 [Acidobacteria bacterium]|nr:MAG: hypothetical protein DMG68_19700 [Acidobacteriota bacterium]